MDSCASHIPCHSVDYHDLSQTCYYSNHQGEPTIVTPGFSSAYSLGCTSSCCRTVESSSQGCNGRTSCSPPCIPPKSLGPLKPDLSCGNQGLQYAIYSNTRPEVSNNLALELAIPPLTRPSSRPTACSIPARGRGSGLARVLRSTATLPQTHAIRL